MNDLDIQTSYWDGVAGSKTFTHPLPLSAFRDVLEPTARILDYGCGYGRTCSELADAGYDNVIGIDISEEMTRRGRRLDDRLDLRTFDGNSVQLDDYSFDACLLMAVLTCIPTDAGQERVIEQIHRLLGSGGVLFVSDYPLQSDTRNQRRYEQFKSELGRFGMFRTEGAVFRHHDVKWIHQLLSSFVIMWTKTIRVCTMNGNESDVIQLLAQKR